MLKDKPMENTDKNTHHENNQEFIGLQVNKGIDKPDTVNQDAIARFKRTKTKALGVAEYVEGIRNGNRSVLGKAITLAESTLPKHRVISDQVIEQCLPFAGKSVRIGITGVPGVGKSTFIEAMGTYLTKHGHKLAVLAIDPSSERSKGSILGDKTRMEQLSADKNAFIRPSPSAGTLGGVAGRTRESIILCEAAGFDVIFVETVGVGQSETLVHSMVDFFLLLMLAGAGDELQGIKRGIMEMADGMVITKADGGNEIQATAAKAEYRSALHLFPPSVSGVAPDVLLCSAVNNTGLPEIWEMVKKYSTKTKENGYFNKKRAAQEKYRMYEAIHENLMGAFYKSSEISELLPSFEKQVMEGKTSAHSAADILLAKYFGAKS